MFIDFLLAILYSCGDFLGFLFFAGFFRGGLVDICEACCFVGVFETTPVLFLEVRKKGLF